MDAHDSLPRAAPAEGLNMGAVRLERCHDAAHLYVGDGSKPWQALVPSPRVSLPQRSSFFQRANAICLCLMCGSQVDLVFNKRLAHLPHDSFETDREHPRVRPIAILQPTL